MAETKLDPSLEPTPIAHPLNDFLREVVNTLHSAVDQGFKATEQDPAAADKIIQDCKEMLDVIMAGDVKDWLSTP